MLLHQSVLSRAVFNAILSKAIIAAQRLLDASQLGL
jgi:hypothetical protein